MFVNFDRITVKASDISFFQLIDDKTIEVVTPARKFTVTACDPETAVLIYNNALKCCGIQNFERNMIDDTES